MRLSIKQQVNEVTKCLLGETIGHVTKLSVNMTFKENQKVDDSLRENNCFKSAVVRAFYFLNTIWDQCQNSANAA